jgi:hypothetical protein
MVEVFYKRGEVTMIFRGGGKILRVSGFGFYGVNRLRWEPMSWNKDKEVGGEMSVRDVVGMFDFWGDGIERSIFLSWCEDELSFSFPCDGEVGWDEYCKDTRVVYWIYLMNHLIASNLRDLIDVLPGYYGEYSDFFDMFMRETREVKVERFLLICGDCLESMEAAIGCEGGDRVVKLTEIVDVYFQILGLEREKK